MHDVDALTELHSNEKREKQNHAATVIQRSWKKWLVSEMLFQKTPRISVHFPDNLIVEKNLIGVPPRFV